jgi:hypothetical protein
MIQVAHTSSGVIGVHFHSSDEQMGAWGSLDPEVANITDIMLADGKAFMGFSGFVNLDSVPLIGALSVAELDLECHVAATSETGSESSGEDPATHSDSQASEE